jgi:hypothetical protein
MTSYLANWTPEQYRVLEKALLVAEHRIHETELFTDAALCELIDRHPRDYLTIAAMGNDKNKFEWMTGERGDISADELLRAVKEGQLWLNLIRLRKFHPEYARIVDSVYDELEAKAPGFKAQSRSANLLISSPNAMVYYHLDLPVNMLWHLRGEKQVWVYPHFDERFVAPRNIERLILGKMAEDMPYQPWFEDYAVSFVVKPGQMITWPQNAPHRVTNRDGLNVSLSTEHRNPVARRRLNVHLANHFIREQFGCNNLSIDPHGSMARLKELYARSYQLFQKLTQRNQPEPFSYRKRFRVDPNAEKGYVLLDPEKTVSFEEEEALLVGA